MLVLCVGLIQDSRALDYVWSQTISWLKIEVQKVEMHSNFRNTLMSDKDEIYSSYNVYSIVFFI